jgi:hypothetical protein
MPPILDVAIGLVFVFLLFSLAVTALNEVILSALDKRAQYLKEGLREMFRDTGGGTDGKIITCCDFFKHGMIAALSRGVFDKTEVDTKSTDGVPSYIPGKSFVLSLLSLVLDKDDAARRAELRERIAAIPAPTTQARLLKIADTAGQAASETLEKQIAATPDGQLRVALQSVQTALSQVKDVRTQIEGIGNKELKETLLSLYDDAAGNFDHFKANIENWFNQSMDRVGGWYKRRAQEILLVLSFVLAVTCNVNTIQIVKALSLNPTLRESIVQQAVNYSKETRANDKTKGTEEAGKDATPASSSVNSNPAPAASAPAPADSPTIAATSSPDSRTPANSAEDKALEAAANSPELLRFKAALANMQGTGLPLGWGEQQRQYFFDNQSSLLIGNSLTALAGWIITALAASLGAPFWFDTLNRFVDIRGVGRAPEEKDPTAPKKKPSETESYLDSGDAKSA